MSGWSSAFLVDGTYCGFYHHGACCGGGDHGGCWGGWEEEEGAEGRSHQGEWEFEGYSGEEGAVSTLHYIEREHHIYPCIH